MLSAPTMHEALAYWAEHGHPPIGMEDWLIEQGRERLVGAVTLGRQTHPLLRAAGRWVLNPALPPAVRVARPDFLTSSNIHGGNPVGPAFAFPRDGLYAYLAAWDFHAAGSTFLTGSRAYGMPRPDSDYDVAVLTTEEIANAAALTRFWHTNGDYVCQDGWSFKRGNLNVLAFTDRLAFDAWKDATSELIGRRPVTRPQAIEVIDGYLARYRT